jgi:outer membrane protein assembly factor BamD (BamD/ComL family)
MRRIAIIVCGFVAFLLIFSDSASGLDKYYLLRKGNLARDEGRLEKAIRYYQEYIESHPTTRDAHSAQYHRQVQYYLKNLLIAYSNLLDLYREEGKQEEIDTWIKRLKAAYSGNSFGSKNMYSLALIYLDNNLPDDAISLFERIIKEQDENYIPHNNKVTLRACSKILNIYQSRGEDEKLTKLIASLHSVYPTLDFDLKDTYSLATLYLRYGLETAGEELLKQVIDAGGTNPEDSDMNVIMRAYSGLVEIYRNRKDESAIEALLEKIPERYFVENLSPHNRYKLAVNYLKCGKREKGSSLLVQIKDQHLDTIFGRKALFLLGRVSQSDKDWDSAIKYYAEYIDRYPDPPFFALKAYSRLIDSYWSRDAKLEFVKDEIKTLSDIVNGISDFETQLNLARDLKWKGMDDLSSATFQLGLSSARKFISEHEGTYEELRVHWLIEKYAFALDRFDLIEESGTRIFELIDNMKDMPLKQERKERVEYIRSQTYLWLAKYCRTKGDYQEARRLLRMFIEGYPNHREIDYARYELGRVCEDAKNVNEAMSMYQVVQDGMWKKKAQERLQRILDRSLD